jgi:N-acetylglutamate synthase-like GNAT family acetyltransferase
MNYRIVAAEARHIGEVERVLAANQLPLDGLSDQYPHMYAVAQLGADLVGVAGIEQYGTVGLLRSVAVVADARGRGVGRALVLERIEFARQRELQRVFLLTTTAARFFESLGFVATARDAAPASLTESVEFARACPASAICMSRLP